MLSMLACNGLNLTPPQAPTPAPTRTPLPTFTATPDTVAGVIIVTPPQRGTPGVVILPEGANAEAVLTLLPTNSPVPIATDTLVPQPGVTAPVENAPPADGSSSENGDATPVPLPTDTPTNTPLPTDTPIPTLSPTPTITPSPFAVVDSGDVALRTGPGVEYPLVALLGEEIPVPITGRVPEGNWFRLCCVNAGPGITGEVWVAKEHISVRNNVDTIPMIIASPPPTPTPTFTPTDTPLPTPTATATRYPFEVAVGPQFFPTNNNDLLTIWVKLFVGTLQTTSGCVLSNEQPPANKESPAPGYFLKVLFNGSERLPTNPLKPSGGGIYFECSAPPGLGNRVEYNYKYEWRAPDPNSTAFKEQWAREHPAGTPVPARCDLIGNGTWTLYVMDGLGNQLSDPVTFTTQGCANPNREIYVGWVRTR